MAYLIILFIILIWISFQFSSHFKGIERKKLAAIRLSWGSPKTEPPNFDRVSKYTILRDQPAYHRLSSQTMVDIDFPELFTFVDRTTSRIGQQYLFDILIHPSGEIPKLQSREREIEYFISNPAIRESVQIDLLNLSGTEAYHLTSLLRPNILKRPAWLKFAWINLVLIAVCLMIGIAYAPALLGIIFLFSVNVVIHYWNKSNIDQYILSFSQLNTAIDTCEKISQKATRFSNDLIRNAIAEFRPFQLKLTLLEKPNSGSAIAELGLIFTYFIDLLKAFFLIEVFIFKELLDSLNSRKDLIRNLFQYLGEIDLAISIASVRSGALRTCVPEFPKQPKQIEIIQVYHPLIQNCTPNDLSIDGRSILITGSNMSGKSTFLRTLTINSILAQTINTCFADSFKMPVVKPFSSIRIDDSLLDGKSYYFEEVRLMSTLLQEARSPFANLFVLDEVFKGTNSVERIAAAKAILSYLNQGENIVLVSTHDIELAPMLSGDYELYHFAESIENDELKFDHKIKSGPLTTRNAIRILELFNYPEEIVREAKALCSMVDGAGAIRGGMSGSRS